MARNNYMIGIKGVGMTMLAQFLRASGERVSGSDVAETYLSDKVLRREGIKVYSPFAVANMPADVDRVIYSTAYSRKNNPELAALLNIPASKRPSILSYPEALGQVFNHYRGIAVCGSHGKTTTAAWLGYVLLKSGLDPNVAVGSRVPQFGGSSLKGHSKYFVAEVDEYQNKLRYFSPYAALINNIEFDHPDFFKNQAAYTKVFSDFVGRIPRNGFLIINKRDAETRKAAGEASCRLISYDLAVDGWGSGADYLAYGNKVVAAKQSFRLSYHGRDLGEFRIKLWGEHNILNALAVIAAARELKVPLELIRKHLASFSGTERRAQKLGEYRGALIIDDYAHHPTEIRTTIAGLQAFFPGRRLRVLFHPHTFTRTKALFSDFVSSFSGPEELGILDIYASARESRGGVSSRQLVRAIKERNRMRATDQKLVYLPTLSEAAAYYRRELKRGDLLLLMGAGDVFRVGEEILATRRQNKK